MSLRCDFYFNIVCSSNADLRIYHTDVISEKCQKINSMVELSSMLMVVTVMTMTTMATVLIMKTMAVEIDNDGGSEDD